MSTLKKNKRSHEITAEDLDNKNMKVRVNCWVDGEIILELRKRAEDQKTKYQTLLNTTLRDALFGKGSENIERRLTKLESIVLKK
jgi:hypothetical protein